MPDVIVWADIPVTDMERAMGFYRAMTGLTVSLMPGDQQIAVIGGPAEGESGEGGEMAVSADLYVGTPSKEGATVYFGSGGDIDGMLQRVEAAGGTVVQPKQDMGQMIGWIAFVIDTEGNRIGIQEPSM